MLIYFNLINCNFHYGWLYRNYRRIVPSSKWKYNIFVRNNLLYFSLSQKEFSMIISKKKENFSTGTRSFHESTKEFSREAKSRYGAKYLSWKRNRPSAPIFLNTFLIRRQIKTFSRITEVLIIEICIYIYIYIFPLCSHSVFISIIFCMYIWLFPSYEKRF